MNNLEEIYENNYVSVETFNAEDKKPFKFAICVEIHEVENNKFLVIVNAAKLPKYLTKSKLKSIASSMCIEPKEVSVTDVSQYGLSAPLDSYLINENEIESKLNKIDKQIPIYDKLCGFYFDRQANRVGKTGWDFLNGNIN